MFKKKKRPYRNVFGALRTNKAKRLMKHLLTLEQLENRLPMDASIIGTAGVDQIRVSPGTVANSVRVSSDNGSFAPQVFTNLSGTLFLQPSFGEDTITIEPLGSRFSGNVVINDPGSVTLKNIDLTGSLTVNAIVITAADGSVINTKGDIQLLAKSESSLTFPLSQIGLKDRVNDARVNIGSASLSARNIKLTSDAGATRIAKSEFNQDTRAVALADVNGDQRPDLIVVNSDVGTGGGLGGPLLLFLNTGKSDPFDGSIPITIARGGAMTSVAIADVNGDSKPDLVVGSSANPDLPGTAIFSRLFLNTGSATLPFRDVPGRVFTVGTGSDFTNSVALADLNSDGRPDLVLGNGVGIAAGQVAKPTASRIIFNSGGANPFTGQGTTLGLENSNTRAIKIADVNNDGKPDIVAGNAAYTNGSGSNAVNVPSFSRVFINAGGTSPFSGAGLAIGSTSTDVVTSLAVGDVNNDGRLDIAFGIDGRPVRLFTSTASDFAYKGTVSSLGANAATKGVEFVDANGDGKLDLVVANAGTSRIYLGSGTAIPFTTAVDLGADGAESKATIAVAAADLTGDGRADLVIGFKGGPTQFYVNDGSQRPYVDANVKAVSLDPTLTSTIDVPKYDQFNVLGSVVKSKATAIVNIASQAVLTATQDVVIASTALADARNTTVGMVVGFTVGIAEPTATVALASGAVVKAGGNFDFQAKANASLDVSVITASPALLNIDVAYGKANAISSATLATGSKVTAGNVVIAATNTNNLSTAAGGYNLSLGGPVAGGIGVAVSDYNSSAKALLNGTLDATVTDAVVDAKSINVKDSTVGTASVIGTADLINFIRGLLKGISNKLGASTKSVSALNGGPKQGTISSLLSAAPSDFSAVGFAAGIAVPESTNAAEARIGSKAVVTVKRNLRVSSRAEDNFKVIATGDSGGSAIADLGGGVAVSTLSNTAIASLDGGSDVQVDGQTRVQSNAVYPNPVNSAIPGFRFAPPTDNSNAPADNDADRIANGYQMGQALADGISTYLVQTVVPVIKGVLLGDPSAVGTSFVKGTGGTKQGGKLGIGGGVNIINIANNSTAVIGTGAKINQRPKAGAVLTAQEVWVDSASTIITMNFGNQISALNVNKAGAGAGGAVGIGGQFEYIGYNNNTKAYIEDGAIVTANRDLKVTADTFNYLLTVAQAGAKASKLGVGGTMVFHELRNQTLAYAEEGAVLSAGRDLQILANNQLQVFNAGGGITQGSTVGVGVSVAANYLQQNDTFAFIGDNNRVAAIGSARAGRNMDVKANANTLVVGVAISGSAADGLPPPVDEPKGRDAFTSDSAWIDALTKYQISLNPKGGVGVAGDAVINSLTSDTRAYIVGSSRVTVGSDLTVDAKDTSLFAAASGAIAYANSTGIGGSLAVNSIRRNTLATIEKTSVTAGGVSITAQSFETPVTVTVGAGIAKNNAAVAGSLSFTDVVSDVKATLGQSAPVTTTRAGSATTEGGGLNIQANRVSNTYSVAGVASASISGAASVGLAVDLALQDGEILASINAPVSSAGNVRVFAADSQKLFGVAAGIAAAINDGAGVAGSATVDKITQVAKASIAPNARVNAGGTIRVDSDGLLQNIRVAGGVAGGKRAGVGGAFTINLVPNRLIQAEIGSGAIVNARGIGPAVSDPQDPNRSSIGVAIDANTVDRGLLFAAAGGVSPGTLGLAGSAVGDSFSNNITEAVIRSGAIINQLATTSTTQDVTVSANHDTSVLSVAGSIAAAKTFGVGAAVVTESIERKVNASLERDVNVKAARFLTVDATSSLPLTTVAGAVAGAINAAAAAGSVIIQTLTTDTNATVGQSGADTKATISAGAIRVWADSESQQTAVAGVVSGSSKAGIGASNVTIVQTNKTRSSLADSTSVTTTGTTGLTAPSGLRDSQGKLLTEPIRGIAAVATAQENITSIAAGATGGKVGLAGSVTVTTLDLSTSSSIGGKSLIKSPISLVAADDTNITGGGGAGGGGAYGGVGAGIDVQKVKKSVLSLLQSNVTVAPTVEGDVAIRALSTGNQLSVSAAIAAGGFAGVAGGASGIDSSNVTQAILGGGSNVTANGNIVVTAEDTSAAVGIAGSIGAGQAAGVGASLGIAIVNKDTSAVIQTGATVNANPANLETWVADGRFAITEQLPVGGLFDSRNDINAQAQTIKLDAPHNFSAGQGQSVQYSAGGGAAVPGLVDGRTYYVIVVNPTTVKLASTAAKARSGISDIFPSAVAGVATHSLTPTGQGPIPVRDGVDLLGNQQVQSILQRRGLTPTRRTVQGVAVSAVNLGRVESYAASAGAGMAAVPISAAVDVITSIVNARVDGSSNVKGANVLVTAGNELLHLGVGGAIGVTGGATVAPGIQVPIATLETRAIIGDSVKVDATKNVGVFANASEDVLSFAIGLSRGAVAVGGSVGVLSLKSTTVAQTGTGSVILAGGNVGVESYDTTNAVLLTGAAAVGSTGGLGGSVAVVYLDKDTKAALGANSTVSALGQADSDLFTFAVEPRGRSVNGILVQAQGSQNLLGVAAAGTIGSFGGLAGAVTVATSNTRTTAEVGNLAKLNNVPGSSPVPVQDVVVFANDLTTTRAFSGALVVANLTSGLGGLAGGVDVGLLNPVVLARVGTGATIQAARDLVVTGRSRTDVRSAAGSAAAGNFGVAGAVSVYALGDGLSDDAKRSLKANDPNNPATASGYIDDVAKAQQVTGLLAQYQSSANSSEADKRAAKFLADSSRVLQASLPAGRASTAIAGNPSGSVSTLIESGATLVAGGDAHVTGDDVVSADILTGTIAAGAGAFGGAVGIATVGHKVDVRVEGSIASTSDVLVSSQYSSDLKGGAGAGLGSSNGVTVGLVGIGAQVTRFQDDSSNSALLSGAVSKADTLTVEALRNGTITSNAQGVTAGGVVVGVASAYSIATGGTKATITGQVGQTPGQTVNNLVVRGESVTQLNANTKAVAGGVLAGAGSDAQSSQSNTGDVVLTGARIKVAGDASLSGSARQSSTANANGINAGALSVGVSKATTQATANGRVFISGGTVINAGRDINATANADAIVSGIATASGGGLIGADATTVSNTIVPTSQLLLNNDVGAVQLISGRNIHLLSDAGHHDFSVANSNVSGFLGTGKTEVVETRIAKPRLDVLGAVVTASGNIAMDVNSVDGNDVGQTSRLFATGAAPTSVSLVSVLQTNLTFGFGSRVVAGAALTLNASTIMDPDFTSRSQVAAIGNLSSTAQSASILATNILLGDAQLVGVDVVAQAIGRITVSNFGSAFVGALTSDFLLNQFDSVVNNSLVSSSAGGSIRAKTWTPISIAGVSADGTRNGTRRTTYDSNTTSNLKDIKGQVIIV